MRWFYRAAVLVGMACLAGCGGGKQLPPIAKTAEAAELKVLAGGSIAGPLNELKAQFEGASGHKLTIHFDSTPNLIKQVTSDAPFDLGVVGDLHQIVPKLTELVQARKG